jgi:cobalamin transport system substrate-binding protein
MRPALRAALAAIVLASSAALPALAGEPLAAPVPRTAGGPRWLGPPATARPRRVVSLTPSLTDVVVAMGLGDRLVGVTRVDEAPEVAALPRVGGYVDPNLEAIVGLRPDLVLWAVNDASAPAVRLLAEMRTGAASGVPVLAVPAESLADALAAPRLVGDALGEAEAGRALQAAMVAAVERFRARASRLSRRRFLFLVGRSPLVAAGPGTFPDELLRGAGYENVVRGGPLWPLYPLEKAVADDPDVVIDLCHREPEANAARLQIIPAVRHGRRIALRTDDMLRPGPRLIHGLEELFQALRAGAP